MKKKAIFHNILGSVSNFAFLLVTSMVMLPYYFRFISAADYGIWLGGISFLSIATVLEANISFILTQQLGERWVSRQRDEFSRYLTAALLFGLAAGVVIILLTWTFRNTIFDWVSHTEAARGPFTTSFVLYAVSISFTIVFSYVNCVTQVFLKTLWSPMFNLAASAAGIVFMLLAVPSLGILALAWGNLLKSVIYSLLVAAYVIILLRKERIPFAFDARFLGRLLNHVGFPFVSKVGMTLAASLQNFLVAASISPAAATIFDVTRKLPLMVQMLINTMAVATFTSFSLLYSEQKDQGAGHAHTGRYFTMIRIILLFSLAAVFLAGRQFVDLWVGDEKYGGDLLLALLCLTAAADQMRLVLSQQYYAAGRFNLTSFTDLSFAAIFMVLAPLLIPSLRMTGIVLAGIGANLIYFTACLLLEKRYSLHLASLIVSPRALSDLLFVVVLALSAYTLVSYAGGGILLLAGTLTLMLLILTFYFLRRDRDLFAFVSETAVKTLRNR